MPAALTIRPLQGIHTRKLCCICFKARNSTSYKPMMRSIGAKDKSSASLSSGKRFKTVNAHNDSMRATQLRSLDMRSAHQLAAGTSGYESMGQMPLAQLRPLQVPPQIAAMAGFTLRSPSDLSPPNALAWTNQSSSQGALQLSESPSIASALQELPGWFLSSSLVPSLVTPGRCFNTSTPGAVSQLYHPLDPSLDLLHGRRQPQMNSSIAVPGSMTAPLSNANYRNDAIVAHRVPVHPQWSSFSSASPAAPTSAALTAHFQNRSYAFSAMLEQGLIATTNSAASIRNEGHHLSLSGTSAFARSTALPLSMAAARPMDVTFATTRCLSCPTDRDVLSQFQVYLRLHMEAFMATSEDMSCSIRGRNKQVRLHQVGLRCRYCAHVAPVERVKASTYFPVSTTGFYQAAQNMSSSHMQCGLCPEMPDSVKKVFAKLLATKMPGSSSKGGRKYWGQCALSMGLVNTDLGVFPRHLVPPEASLVEPCE